MSPSERQRHDLFLRLYLEHEDALRGFVRSLVPTREDSREVMQEVAAVLWRKFESISSPGDFRRWAFGVARFEAFQVLRSQRRDRHVFGNDVLELLARDAEKESSLHESEARAMEHCMQTLPPTQRLLVQAAYAPGARIDQLARQSGRTPMALYKTLHRIRISLVDCVRAFLEKEART